MKFKFLFILIIILIVSLSLNFFVNNKKLVDYQEIPIYVTVGDHLGFNVNNSALFFGTIQKGSYSFRSFVVKNEKCESCKVEIKVGEQMEGWIEVSENNFLLKKGEYKELVAYAFIPEGSDLGDYEGKLIIYFWKDI